jgi:hypothetical protein
MTAPSGGDRAAPATALRSSSEPRRYAMGANQQIHTAIELLLSALNAAADDARAGGTDIGARRAAAALVDARIAVHQAATAAGRAIAEREHTAPAGGDRGRPGVAGRAPQIVVGVPAHPELRHVRPRDRDRARCAQRRDMGDVLGRSRRAQRDGTEGGRRAGHVDVRLDRHRDPAKHTPCTAGPHPPVDLVRPVQSGVGQNLRRRGDGRVDRGDPRQVRRHHLPRGHLPVSDPRGQLRRTQLPQLRHPAPPTASRRAGANLLTGDRQVQSCSSPRSPPPG